MIVVSKVDESPLARVRGRADHVVRLNWTTGRYERTDGWKEGIVGDDIAFVRRRKGIAVFWTKNESMAVHHHNENDDASQKETDDADYDQMVVANHRPSIRLMKLVVWWYSFVGVGCGDFYIWKFNRTTYYSNLAALGEGRRRQRPAVALYEERVFHWPLL